MKKTIIFLSAILISFNVVSQISTNETPTSFKENFKKKNIPVIIMPTLNYEIIDKEDFIDSLNGLPPRFGYDFDVDINMKNSGVWTELPNKKGRLWQLRIYSPGALSINLLYDKFYIPEGGKFFIYSPDEKKKLGAFTHRNNKGDKEEPGAFATSLILNEKIILEYYEPNNTNEVPVISITKVVHGYRNITPFDFGDSDDDCEININCDEGADWQDEKTSVALIVVGGTRWCTGSLINNTQGDGAPYLLTADHCLDVSGLDAISNPAASTWTFLWNYESPTCDNGADFIPPSTVGATVVANNSSSDFALLELDETPFDLSPSLCIYYNGWDKSGSTPSNATCIHHPAGDIKKISVSNSSPSSDGNFWNVTFNQGIVEGGSSGSPLFNQNSRIIGQLFGTPTADPISCHNQDGLAVYGKLSVSWNNSSDSRRRLKDWLDPLGTNPNNLNGAYLFPTNNTTISGPSAVCSSGVTFTINNLPDVDSIIWEPGPFLTVYSGQNTDSPVIKATGNESSWIKARLVTACGSITLPGKSVWAGSPWPTILLCTVDNTYPGSVGPSVGVGCTSQDYWLYAHGSNLSDNDADYRWKFYSSNPFELPVQDIGRQVEFSRSLPGTYSVSL
ncbi:trypsin-like peptidase domain-containing protein [Mariniphaga sp.]|uniref:trypsin-like peptidase domain-containing protein n=1 Tax=Mariniphaga sp. TaxID=1954475 RepID=UPI0035652417